ncbi:protein SMG8 [Nilaparvata lugens]|uniref:protein SMG8 n=1 Tax=Nilaparvata lugens TaxID=108931 RepID=UPI00193E2268|nr:protein SMG8 [Nilaparvata lugens]
MKPRKFNLPYKDFERDLSSALDRQVVVVSFFGKSAYNAKSYKMAPIDSYLKQQIFKSSVLHDPTVNSDFLCDIEGYYDPSNCVIYLHLVGAFDTYTLTKLYTQFSADLDDKGFLSVWTDLKHRYSRALLFLFSVSHILVLVHPTHVFDVSYIHLFRSLDAVRLKLQKTVIQEMFIEWHGGRLCSPRVLFYFQRAPSLFRKSSSDSSGVKNSSIKKLKHSIEDQIYHILRKSRVVTNICANSLFAIPANQEFVFIEMGNKENQDWHSYLLESMIDLCLHPNQSAGDQSNCSPSTYEYTAAGRMEGDPNPDYSFKKFLMQHVNLALKKGFDDNVGRHVPNSNHFVVPTLGSWFEVADKLLKLYLEGAGGGRGEGEGEAAEGEGDCRQQSGVEEAIELLHSQLDTDVAFSKARCSKVLPLATATYQENLPAHYTREYHLTKVAHALSVFGIHARGPLVDSYVTRLEKECEKHWKNGRQMCEVLSLTGNPCTNPLHRSATGDSVNLDAENRSDLPVMEHSSGVRYVSACDCGRRQGPRDDPFTVRAANCDFYTQLGDDCQCGSALERIHFPVFQPSTTDYKAAQLFSKTGCSVSRKESRVSSLKDGTQQGNTQVLSLAFVSGQSGGVESSDMLLEAAAKHSASHNIVIRVSDSDSENSKEKGGLVRQPSTTEYLPGMLHSLSPASLLPQFPSWSLVCLGPSSLYSHNLGLQEHSGLLNGSAYLLPWDVTVKLEHSFWPAPAPLHSHKGVVPLSKGRKSKATKDLTEFSVKIFVGVEYECPRGHRFMCSGPDKVLKTSGGGLVKDNGNKVTGCDMPLYFPCPCRPTKPPIAQLMRVHVVTPKAPVHVTLQPRVQPAPPPCPVFVTGCQQPIKLSQSAYWVLRLPYVYHGERGPYLPPKDATSQNYGRLLNGMYGISEVIEGK